MDHVLHTMRRGGAPPDAAPLPDVIARFLVTKASWRGRYRRVLSITPSAVLTQHPDDGTVTNVWRFTGSDPELEAAGPSGGSGDDLEFMLSTRKDSRVSASCATM